MPEEAGAPAARSADEGGVAAARAEEQADLSPRKVWRRSRARCFLHCFVSSDATAC